MTPNRFTPPPRDDAPDVPLAVLIMVLLGAAIICFAAADAWGRAVL